MKNAYFISLIMLISTPIFALDAQVASENIPTQQPFVDCQISENSARQPKSAISSELSPKMDAGENKFLTNPQNGCYGKYLAAAIFISETYTNLIADTARGSGDYLEALLSILEVPDDNRPLTIFNLRRSCMTQLNHPDYVSMPPRQKSALYYQYTIEALGAINLASKNIVMMIFDFAANAV
jgi:hypothetical protein